MPNSAALGDHFENFVTQQVANGRFNNECEVMRAGLRLLEEHELKIRELRTLVDEGERDLADGRFVTVKNADEFAADISTRGRARAAAKAPRA